MPLIIKRKIVRVGDSLGLTIPKFIVDTYDLKKGEAIFLITDAVDEKFLLIDLKKRSKQELKKIVDLTKN